MGIDETDGRNRRNRMKTKGSLRRIPPETKVIITQYVFKPENRDKSRIVLADELEALLGDASPSLDTLTRMISRIRNTVSPLDTPWHLGTLRDYPLPADAVAKILEIRAKTGQEDMTIRKAQWVARLMALPLAFEALVQQAAMYALQEKIADAIGIPFDSSEYDQKALLAELKSPDGGKAIAQEIDKAPAKYDQWLADYEKTHSTKDVEMFRSLSESERKRSKGLLLQYFQECEE
jgi:hypothetical protein